MYGKMNLGIISDITDWFRLIYIFKNPRLQIFRYTHACAHAHPQSKIRGQITEITASWF